MARRRLKIRNLGSTTAPKEPQFQAVAATAPVVSMGFLQERLGYKRQRREVSLCCVAYCCSWCFEVSGGVQYPILTIKVHILGLEFWILLGVSFGFQRVRG